MARAVHTFKSAGEDTSQFYIDLERRREEYQREAGLRQVTFDLSRPLAEQLVLAEELLSGWQREYHGRKNARKPHLDNWPLFLRAIDARDAGATYAAMVKAFWPGQDKSPQSARDTHKAACQLRDNFPI
jgi:hypothetical protein